MKCLRGESYKFGPMPLTPILTMVLYLNNITDIDIFRSAYNRHILSAEMTILFCDVIMAVTIILGILGNICVCLCICRNRHLQTYMNVNLVSSCIANIIGCVGLLPIRIQLYTGFPSYDSVWLFCNIGTFFRTLCDTLQFFMLTMASLERYQAVTYPFKKTGLQRRSTILVTLSWVVGLTMAIMSTVFFIDSALYVPCTLVDGSRTWLEYDTYLIFPLGLSLLCVILGIYTHILKTLFQHSASMNRYFTKKTIKVSTVRQGDSSINILCKSENKTTKRVPDIEGKSIDVDTTERFKNALSLTVNQASGTTPGHICLKVESDSEKYQPISFTHSSALPNATNVNINSTGYECICMREQTVASAEVSHLPKHKTVSVVEMDGSVQVRKTNNEHVAGAVCLMSSKNRENGRRRVEVRASRKIATLIGLCAICWLPLPVFVTSISVSGYTTPSESLFRVLIVLGTIGCASFALNPILISITNKPINSALRKLLKLKK